MLVYAKDRQKCAFKDVLGVPTVFTSHPVEYIIERSRFIGTSFHMATVDDLPPCLSEVKRAYPLANHYTFVYRIDSAHQRAFDDGEPQGTAGLPILNILVREGWEETLVIVVRYFGGIKLGRGGLVHAYQHAAQLALQSTVAGQRMVVRHALIHLDYALYERVHRSLKAYILSEEATFAADVTLELTLADENWPRVQALIEQAGGHRQMVVASSLQPTIVPISAPSSESRAPTRHPRQ
ncbi:MAG: IMPACT family protein [Sulfobacillus acidophilus]|uniref:IMPACT family protein n=1 Tax=Sulfobacillus acidophilus TaxID=53633 RepID=A0A2T2WIZ0_9FIRM|nr:MAG: IMPACT family protein [Sulfobacillus acidophilus]